jgi:Rrf2 family protein
LLLKDFQYWPWFGSPRNRRLAVKLSTRGRYATRLMLDLALHYNEGLVLLKDVAARQEISRKYLGHLVASLKGAGLVASGRGAHGGYRLARPPGEIRLGDVIRTVEGDLGLVECVHSPGVCDRTAICAARDVWELMSSSVTNMIDSITLQDMVDRHHRKQANEALMWNI